MSKRSTIFLLALALGLITTVMIANNKKENNMTIRVADMQVVQALPFYVALERGYFEQEGITVEVTKFQTPTPIIDALLSDRVDISSSGPLGIAGIANQKSDGAIKVFMAAGGDMMFSNDSILVPTKTDISSIKDIRNKSLGILPGIQWRTIAKHILTQNSIDPEIVTLVELAPPLQAQALASGQIDALLAIEPVVTIAKTLGMGEVLVEVPTAQFVANPFYGGAGVIRTEFAESNPELTDTVMQIFQRAIKDIRNHPDETLSLVTNHTALTEDITPHLHHHLYKLSSELTENDKKALQQFYDIFYSYNVVDKPIKTEDVLY